MASTFEVEREVHVDAPAAALHERIAGAGRMEMVEAIPDQRVVIDQRNFKPLKSEAKVAFSLTRFDEGTTVTWSMTGQTNTMTKVMGIFKSMDKMIGPVFEKGLAGLKADAEEA